jgi:8-oxo-dGTP diphosphatase
MKTRTTKRARRVIAVGAVIYRREDDGALSLVLIKKQGGYWTLPKGKVHCDEAQRAAVAREVLEETGVMGAVEHRVKTVVYSIRKHGVEQRKEVTYYLLHYESGELSPDVAEGIIRARWVSIDEALRRIKRGRVRRVVRAATVILG